MKIWHDTMSIPPHSSSCDGEEDDCDCSKWGNYDEQAISHLSGSSNNWSSAENIGIFRSKALLHSAPTHIQPCSDDTWLVCNPVGSGEIAVLDAEAFSVFQRFSSPATLGHVLETSQGESASSVENVVTLLYNTGLLRDAGRTFRAREEQQSQTLQAWLHVTNACNLSCEYCYISKSSEHMADDTSRRAVEAIFRSAVRQHFKRVRVKYAGGEASLYLSRILALHTYANQLAEQHDIEFSAYVISNGVALSQRTIEALKAHKISVTISLDGVGTHHDQQRIFANGMGSFKYVDRTIARLLASGVVPHINVTVTQRNLPGLPSLMAYILERDMPFTLSYYRENACSHHLGDLQFTDEQMIRGMREAFNVIETMLPRRRLLGSLIDKADLRNPHTHTCSAGRSYLVVDQHGGIAKCHSEIRRTLTSVDADDPLRIIQEDRSGFQNLPADEKEGCKTCMWRYWCTGGCPLVTYQTTGRNDIRSPNCHIYQALFPDALRLEALRLLKYGLPVVL
jgi:uncharacterized protein